MSSTFDGLVAELRERLEALNEERSRIEQMLAIASPAEKKQVGKRQQKSGKSRQVSPTLLQRTLDYMRTTEGPVRSAQVAAALKVSKGSASKSLSTLAKQQDQPVEMVADRVPGEKGAVHLYGLRDEQEQKEQTELPVPQSDIHQL
jgi:hypothetical protein